jgi:DNA-binding response OmpR family regulator
VGDHLAERHLVLHHGKGCAPADTGDIASSRSRPARRGQAATRSTTTRLHRIGEWLIELDAHAITAVPGRCGTGPRLTPKEWRVLTPLLAHPGALVGPGQLLTEVWGQGSEGATNYLPTYFWQLRAKLELDPSHPRHLMTEPGMGYQYVP